MYLYICKLRAVGATSRNKASLPSSVQSLVSTGSAVESKGWCLVSMEAGIRGGDITTLDVPTEMKTLSFEYRCKIGLVFVAPASMNELGLAAPTMLNFNFGRAKTKCPELHPF